MAERVWRRVLLKVSGEMLGGDAGCGIDSSAFQRISGDVASAVKSGFQVCLVVGGGNFFRGQVLDSAGGSASRVNGDKIGMLATLMNAIMLENFLIASGVPARAMSSVSVPTFCETFTQRVALDHMERGCVPIFGGGTGNPFFTTDTTAVLRALEMGCDALFKGTHVDGVYSADPLVRSDALRYDRLTCDEVLQHGLRVMDATAIAMAGENSLPIIVFSLKEAGSFRLILEGSGRCTEVMPN